MRYRILRAVADIHTIYIEAVNHAETVLMKYNSREDVDNFIKWHMKVRNEWIDDATHFRPLREQKPFSLKEAALGFEIDDLGHSRLIKEKQKLLQKSHK